MGRHGAGHGVQFLEVAYPEILIDVHMAVVALCGAAVGAEKAQLGPGLAVFAEYDRVAGQLQAKPRLRKGDDVATENLGLGAACRQEHLVIASQHRVHEGFAGEVVGQAHLAAFEDVPDPGGQRVLFCSEQLFLVSVHFADELVEKVHFAQLADVVLDLLFPLLAVALSTLLTLAALIIAAMAIVVLVITDRSDYRLYTLLNQAFANGRQSVQLVQLALGQRVGFLQKQGDTPADGGQRFFIRQHVFPATHADPVVHDPDVGQVQLRLNFLGLVAA